MFKPHSCIKGDRVLQQFWEMKWLTFQVLQLFLTLLCSSCLVSSRSLLQPFPASFCLPYAVRKKVQKQVTICWETGYHKLKNRLIKLICENEKLTHVGFEPTNTFWHPAQVIFHFNKLIWLIFQILLLPNKTGYSDLENRLSLFKKQVN